MNKTRPWLLFLTVLAGLGTLSYGLSAEKVLIIAPAATLIAFLLGTPAQIYKTWQLKSAKEISFLRTLFWFVSATIWIRFSVKIDNDLLLYTNVIGVALSSIMLAQYMHYEVIGKSDWKNWRKYL